MFICIFSPAPAYTETEILKLLRSLIC